MILALHPAAPVVQTDKNEPGLDWGSKVSFAYKAHVCAGLLLLQPAMTTTLSEVTLRQKPEATLTRFLLTVEISHS